MEKRTRSKRQTWILTGISVLVIAAVAAGIIYWTVLSQRIYVDSASIEAPEITLSPSHAGVLEQLYVQPGDTVIANQTVAQVGDELIPSKIAGVIVAIDQKIGAQIAPGQPIVTMIDPDQLRVVGEVDENKGLSDMHVGDPVVFTVDAFGNTAFSGVVDEVSPTSKQSGIVFNISNQREVKQFAVKGRFDVSKYPQLKNGMSARMWIYVR
jgi:multidrug resistance efflux pump